MSTLKVNKLRDTAGSADAITLDPNGGAVLAGVTTMTTARVTSGIVTNTFIVGAGVTISESGIEASGIGITCANINGTQIGGRRNIVINGAMQVAQRGSSDSGITASEYADGPDRWKLGGSSFGTVTVSQSTDSPDGFSNSYKVDVTTANASLSAGSLLEIQTSFEGQDVQHFAKGSSAAKEYTLSFYVKTTKTGTYIAMLQDHDNTRLVSKTYTVSDTNWNRYIITYPADTTGAFGNDNEKSMSIKFVLVAGTSFTSGTLQTTWGASSNSISRGGQVNFADSTSNEWYLTGVQLEVGPQATAFEHRSYGDELALCQRYYYRQVAGDNEFFRGMAMADVDGNSIELNSPFPTTMRIAPTAIEQTGTASNYKIRRSTTATCTSVPSFGHATTDQLQCRFTKSSHGFGDGSAVRCASGTSGAYIGVSAEL